MANVVSSEEVVVRWVEGIVKRRIDFFLFSVRLTWTGCERHNVELNCTEFLFTTSNGDEVVVPEFLMVDAEEVVL